MNAAGDDPATKPEWLVFGASGAVGRFLLPQLVSRGLPVLAVTRGEPPQGAASAVRWIRADLEDAGAIATPEVVISLGPLDRFAAWLARAAPASVRRVVALSSTSATTKAGSAEPAERELAARLRQAEAEIAAQCERRGARWTLLRPTLVYGGGGDRNLSRLASLALRLGVLPLPATATGLRQPVHAADVARAVADCVDAPAAADHGYDLPGGETLTYREMVARTLACLPGRPRLLLVPAPFARPLFALAASALGAGPALARTREDLVFDADEALRDFGYRPRAFEPDASMFV